MYEAKSIGRDRVIATDQFALTDLRDGRREIIAAAKRAAG
jgi:hypothetical protein